DRGGLPGQGARRRADPRDRGRGPAVVAGGELDRPAGARPRGRARPAAHAGGRDGGRRARTGGVPMTLFGRGAGSRRVSLVRLSSEIARSIATIGKIAVEGEVHRAVRRGGGWQYFTLKDRAAQVSVVCPGARAKRCRAVDGERVLVTGRLVWASDRGQLQL